MLYLEIDPPAGLFAPRRLRDDERQLVFTFVGTMDRGSLWAYKLQWGERSIPFTARAERRSRADGSTFLVYGGLEINGMATSHPEWSGAPATLGDDERVAATRLEMECVLAFGQAYDGLNAPAGAYAVETSDGLFWLTDFGYTPHDGLRSS